MCDVASGNQKLQAVLCNIAYLMRVHCMLRPAVRNSDSSQKQLG
jgi:hypothetical protein